MARGKWGEKKEEQYPVFHPAFLLHSIVENTFCAYHVSSNCIMGSRGVKIMPNIQIACAKTVQETRGVYRLQPAIVHVQDTKIVQVEVFFSDSAWQQAVDQRSGQDGLLILQHHIVSPAFVNAHTHVSMGFFRGVLAKELQQKNLMED